jgi:LuxR family transcriptional regulator, maltose regulon positive regulatory protein
MVLTLEPAALSRSKGTNLSRPEIARELSVSVNTVNTHIRNIYAKLQAQDRFSAVRRAREMRLLSAGLQLDR